MVTVQLSACNKTCWREKYTFDTRIRAPLVTSWVLMLDALASNCREATSSQFSLSFSGSNQAREGRLVNALAVRGDERRDTLR